MLSSNGLLCLEGIGFSNIISAHILKYFLVMAREEHIKYIKMAALSPVEQKFLPIREYLEQVAEKFESGGFSQQGKNKGSFEPVRLPTML